MGKKIISGNYRNSRKLVDVLYLDKVFVSMDTITVELGLLCWAA